MPKGTKLNEFEKGQITALASLGKSYSEISKLVNRSRKVISNFLQNPDSYGTAKHQGRSSKLSSHEERALSRAVSNTNKSCAILKNELNLPVSRWTINRAFNNDKNIVRSKMMSCPQLEECHKAARLKYARRYMTWNEEWTKVVFSDEKKFNLEGPDGFTGYWRDLRKEPKYFSKRNFGGGNLMIWGCFSAYGNSSLAFISHRLNSKMYQEVLCNNLVPYMKRFKRIKFTFMQDNASCHVSSDTKSWISAKKISVLTHPSRSPDLNPIENLWGLLVRAVYKENKKYSTVQELKDAIEQAWEEIPNETLASLANSMPNRIFEVINKNGGYTSY